MALEFTRGHGQTPVAEKVTLQLNSSFQLEFYFHLKLLNLGKNIVIVAFLFQIFMTWSLDRLIRNVIYLAFRHVDRIRVEHVGASPC